jgi:hypothetical protein
MNAAGFPPATRASPTSVTLSRSIAIGAIPPVLVTREDAAPASGPPKRARIWEFSTHLHCSIIGTCVSTGELRQILKKLGLAPPDSTDHELHGTAVSLAGRHDIGGKLLNKALDQRHRLAVSQFARASAEDAVRLLWREAVRRGEVPGAYWATLTHGATTPALIREAFGEVHMLSHLVAFGEVHMLSHLVGSANRADIRRLCELEADKAALEAKLERQQTAFREAVASRDAQLQDLRQALTQRIAAEPPPVAGANEGAVLRQLVADLERRLARETRHGAAAEARLAEARTGIADERSARTRAERDCDALRQELDAIEASLLADRTGHPTDAQPEPRLDGLALLYVGGHPHQVARLRAVGEQMGATFLHHDGGIENHPNLLAGLTSRADLVMFPVDCISHEAATTVKLLCRQVGKRYLPLRSASVTSLLAALRRPEVTGLADAAD